MTSLNVGNGFGGGREHRFAIRSDWIAPFGVPVVPEDNWITAMRSRLSERESGGVHVNVSPPTIKSVNVTRRIFEPFSDRIFSALEMDSRSSSTRSSTSKTTSV